MYMPLIDWATTDSFVRCYYHSRPDHATMTVVGRTHLSSYYALAATVTGFDDCCRRFCYSIDLGDLNSYH